MNYTTQSKQLGKTSSHVCLSINDEYPFTAK